MWLLFYVIDSLSVKLLQEGKQAIQRQPFLHNANLPTSILTDNHPSVSHREFENIYVKCHQHRRHYRRIDRQLYRRNQIRWYIIESSKTITPKCHIHRRIYRRNKIRRHLTESSKTWHNHRREYRRIIVRWHITVSSKIFRTKCHNPRRFHRQNSAVGNLSVTHITDRIIDGQRDFQSV